MGRFEEEAGVVPGIVGEGVGIATLLEDAEAVECEDGTYSLWMELTTVRTTGERSGIAMMNCRAPGAVGGGLKVGGNETSTDRRSIPSVRASSCPTTKPYIYSISPPPSRPAFPFQLKP